MTPYRYRRIVLVMLALLLLAACGGAGGGGAASSGGDAKAFTVGFTSLGLSSAPFMAALDELGKQGYEVETPEIAESELVTEGVAKGDFAFGSGANNAVMTANSKGANLKLLMDRVSNEWTLYARTGITDCAGLDGKKLAIHSEGAVSTAMVKNYIQTNCPGTEPSYVVISGSPNRMAALLADQVDASPLEVTDSVALEQQAGDRYGLLASFSEKLPQLRTTSIYVNGDFAEQNPDTVKAVVKAVLEQHRKIADDPAYLTEIAEQYVGDAVDPEQLDAAADIYVERELFAVDGGLTDENLAYTAEFFGPDGTGAVEEPMTVEEFADLSFLKEALDELGGQ